MERHSITAAKLELSGVTLDFCPKTCQSIDVVCMRGWGWISLVVAVLISKEIFGGPSKPHQSWLMEISPYVEKIESVHNSQSIEIYLEGYADLDCYENQEVQITELPEQGLTKIIPRFRKSLLERPCRGDLSQFRIKAADLDPSKLHSYNLKILGQRGWNRHRVEGQNSLKPQNSAEAPPKEESTR